MNEVKLNIIQADTSSMLELPFADGIKAGFPSPATDYMEDTIDLNKELVHHKETTFYARIVGESMVGAGILDGDLAIIDKSLTAADGDYIAAFIDGEFTLKQFKMQGDQVWLMPANPDFPPIQVTAENEFIIWGVVTGVIHQFR